MTDEATERLNAEAAKLRAEAAKLRAEAEKLSAEHFKLLAESGKLSRETLFYPLVAGAALFGAGAAFFKLFFGT